MRSFSLETPPCIHTKQGQASKHTKTKASKQTKAAAANTRSRSTDPKSFSGGFLNSFFGNFDYDEDEDNAAAANSDTKPTQLFISPQQQQNQQQLFISPTTDNANPNMASTIIPGKNFAALMEMAKKNTIHVDTDRGENHHGICIVTNYMDDKFNTGDGKTRSGFLISVDVDMELYWDELYWLYQVAPNKFMLGYPSASSAYLLHSDDFNKHSTVSRGSVTHGYVVDHLNIFADREKFKWKWQAVALLVFPDKFPVTIEPWSEDNGKDEPQLVTPVETMWTRTRTSNDNKPFQQTAMFLDWKVAIKTAKQRQFTKTKKQLSAKEKLELRMKEIEEGVAKMSTS